MNDWSYDSIPHMLSYGAFNMRAANFSVTSISTYMNRPSKSHGTDGRNVNLI